MQKSIRILISVFVALLGFGAALATGPIGTDDQGNPNDPHKNERANACFDGGTMAGKCNSEWAWTCGWYLIRFEAGIYKRNQVPAICTSVLPGEAKAAPPPSVTWPPAGCYYSAVYSLYIFWNGNQTQPPPIDMTWEQPCGTPTTGVGGFSMVSAPDSATASALCSANGYNFIDELSSAGNTGAWPIYRCQVP